MTRSTPAASMGALASAGTAGSAGTSESVLLEACDPFVKDATMAGAASTSASVDAALGATALDTSEEHSAVAARDLRLPGIGPTSSMSSACTSPGATSASAGNARRLLESRPTSEAAAAAWTSGVPTGAPPSRGAGNASRLADGAINAAAWETAWASNVLAKATPSAVTGLATPCCSPVPSSCLERDRDGAEALAAEVAR
mmetsp:Transcript_33111/g.95075  ORF Transcript_33111/g.95075 Transcript_33111/m.95075 type:complete len:200 (+) Transcript_33111:1178-1777(+)